MDFQMELQPEPVVVGGVVVVVVVVVAAAAGTRCLVPSPGKVPVETMLAQLGLDYHQRHRMGWLGAPVSAAY